MKNITSRVESPNTPESDSQATVWHNVSFDDEHGQRITYRVMAECPMDAIKVAREERANRRRVA